MSIYGITTLLICLLAGIHAASYGAWKDSPCESYLLRRTVRELVFALLVGAVFVVLNIWEKENYLIIYLSTYTLVRAITEFWKLFMRVEPQKDYRIPTQIHYLGKVVDSQFKRFLMGLVPVIVVVCLFAITVTLMKTVNIQLAGIIVGLLYGLADATSGAYKDGSIEGFFWRKFLKSPTLGVLGGLIASFITTNPFFLLAGTIAIARMIIELLFKILSRGYVPGKFKTIKHKHWIEKRKIFLAPYFATWIIFAYLCYAAFYEINITSTQIKVCVSTVVIVLLVLSLLYLRQYQASKFEEIAVEP